MNAILFYICSSVVLTFCVLVVFAKNTFMSAFFMAGALFCMSGIFLVLNAPFLSLVQAVVCSGSVMLLCMYVMMVIHIPTDRTRAYRRIFLKCVHLLLVPIAYFALRSYIEIPTFSQVYVFDDFGSFSSVGNKFTGSYLLLFLLVPVLFYATFKGSLMLVQKVQNKELS